ncbi:hypothetical protein [Rhodococcus sp. BS-15]|uniref:hypothetical protein n=1 Tax=Rhodococcus sp. BS-15 TaxID=1304954 RepID=UPI000FFC53A3|nr:hypothetical protein [Rhodococcus sp. BS-15]
MSDITWATTAIMLIVSAVSAWSISASKLLFGRRRAGRLGIDPRIAGTVGAAGATALLFAAVAAAFLGAEYARQTASSATSPVFLILAVISSTLSVVSAYWYAGTCTSVIRHLRDLG